MWYLIVSIPDLCLLTYFYYQLISLSFQRLMTRCYQTNERFRHRGWIGLSTAWITHLIGGAYGREIILLLKSYVYNVSSRISLFYLCYILYESQFSKANQRKSIIQDRYRSARNLPTLSSLFTVTIEDCNDQIFLTKIVNVPIRPESALAFKSFHWFDYVTLQWSVAKWVPHCLPKMSFSFRGPHFCCIMALHHTMNTPLV